MLIGRKAQELARRENKSPWWINPSLYCLFFLLPFFLITVFTAAPYMDKLGQSVNNLTTDNILLGVLSIVMLTLGALPFIGSKPKAQSEGLEPKSIHRALLFMGGLSLICNLIYFSSILLNPRLIAVFLSGDAAAMYQMRGAMEQIPGITSFISACLPFFALYSYSTIKAEGRDAMPKTLHRLFFILFFFVFARSILGSERLAFVEAIIAYGVPRIAFAWKPSKLRFFLPFIGVIGVFALFAFGEYFRSWQTYQYRYDNYWDFITVRFFGYFATSFNNGSGILENYESFGFPALTANGLYKLLGVFGVDYSPGAGLMKDYLNRYATPEFNLPSGLYIPYIDYGILGGTLYISFFGLLTGILFRSFSRGRALGVLLYPSWFAALLDIMRIWMWGSSRFAPVLLVSTLISFFLVYKERGGKKS